MVAVSSPPTTLIVNPAFLQEIKDSNPDLTHALDDLRQLLRSDESPFQLCRQLTRSLDDLRDHLALQFSLEESYGYLTVSDPPSRMLGELTSRVQSQHGLLYMRLSDLAEQAEELQYRGVEPTQLRVLMQRTEQFDSELREHERAEKALIDQSYDLS